MEKIERVNGKRRFPEHPLAALLQGALRSNRILYAIAQGELWEDAYQESIVFLLSHPWDVEEIKNNPSAKDEFCRAAISHFYRFLIANGWRMENGYRRRFVGFADSTPQGEGYDEDHDGRLAHDPWAAEEESRWFKTHLELCRSILLRANALLWEVFVLWIRGFNPAEIGWKLDLTSNHSEACVREAITTIRLHARLGEDHVLPEIYISRSTKVRDCKIVVPKRNNIRVPISPDCKAEDVMKLYGVSRTTAWRARSRGWIIPNFHPKKKASNAA